MNTQRDANRSQKCKAETYKSWETVKFAWAIETREFGKSFFPNHSLSFLSAIERSLGLERCQDGGYFLLLKCVDESIVSRDKMGLLCIFVDDH